MNKELSEIAKKCQRLGKKHFSSDKVGSTKLVLKFNQYSQETGELTGSVTQDIDLSELSKTITRMEGELKALKGLLKLSE